MSDENQIDDTLPEESPDTEILDSEDEVVIDTSAALSELTSAAEHGELGGEHVQLPVDDEVVEDEPEAPTPTEPEEIYAGEFKPMEGVEEAVPILEEPPFEKLGAVALSNLDPQENELLYRYHLNQVARQQGTRYKIVEEARRSKVPHRYLALELEEGKSLYLTEEERDTLGLLQAYGGSLRQGAGYKLFDETKEEGWTNLPAVGDHKIAIGALNHAKSNDPVLKIRGQLKLSIPFTIPCWHTGIHLKMEGPGVLDQLSLETRVLMEKVDAARETSGFVYSASSVYLNRHVIDFILDHLTQTTAGTTDPAVLKSIIPLTELEPMVLGAAAAIWPDGYNLERPCVNSGNGCDGVVKRKLNLRRMLFVRRRRLSEHQMQFMTKRSGVVDQKSIREYQAQIRPEVSRYIDLGEGLNLKLWVPTLADYDRIASAWMERLDYRARSLISSNASEQDRRIYLKRANDISLVMAFGHWVEGFVQFDGELDTEPKVLLSRSAHDIEDLEGRNETDKKIDGLLEDLSSDSELVEKILQGIEHFINQMTLATVAIGKTSCPKCNLPSKGDDTSSHPHLVNINPVELFFTLLRHKILRAGA